MSEQFCQSCGMPMPEDGTLNGTEKDGSKSADYCQYCYQNGAFTFHGNMGEMIDFCVKPMMESDPNMTEQAARAMMNGFLPTLKRWKQA